MSRPQRLTLLSLLLALSCSVLVQRVSSSATEMRNSASASADEVTLREIVKQYFNAYQQKDLNTIRELWSPKSPEAAQRLKDMERIFARTGRIEVGGPEILSVEISIDRASVHTGVSISAFYLESGAAVPGTGKDRRLRLEYAKERGEWKLFRQVTPEDELSLSLLAAKTDKERDALIENQKELLTVELSRSLGRLGDAISKQKNNAEALPAYRLEMQIAERLNSQIDIGYAAFNIGSALSRLGNYKEALDYFERSLQIRTAIGDQSGVQQTLTGIGVVYSAQGNFTKALEQFQKALKINEAIGSQDNIATSLGSIGNIYNSLDDYPRALDFYQRSLAIREALKDRAGMAPLLGNMGIISKNQGDYPLALERYQKSLAIFQELNNEPGMAYALLNMGTLYLMQGEHEQALNYTERALALREKFGDRKGAGIALQNIGAVHRAQGNYARALEVFQRALTLREELGDQDGLAGTLNSVGGIHFNYGNYDRALEYFQKGLAIRQAIGDKRGVAISLLAIGDIYYVRENYPLALDYYRRSLALREAIGWKRGIAGTFNDLGRVARAQGNYDLALDYFQKALALRESLNDKIGISQTLTDLARLYLLRAEYRKAQEFAARAATIADEMVTHEHLWRAREVEGSAFLGLNEPEKARQSFDAAISSIEELRSQIAAGEDEQQRFFENKVSPYEAMVEVLISQNKTAEAFAYAERAKARVLLDVLKSRRADLTRAMTPQERNEEQRLRSNLVSLNAQIRSASLRQKEGTAALEELKVRLGKARFEYEEFQTRLYSLHPELRVHRGEARPVTPQEAGRLLLDAETAVLEFVVTKKRTYLFVLTAKGEAAAASTDLKIYTLEIGEEALAERAEEFRQGVARRDLGFRQPARQLYELLLRPAAAQLAGRHNLIIIPDGPIWNLPFQALRTSGEKFLIEEHAVSYAPSLTVLGEIFKTRSTLAQPRTTRPATPTLLAFGNPMIGAQAVARLSPVLAGEDLAPLQDAEKQVMTLGRLYGHARSKVYVGAEASEARVKTEAVGYSVLQFATHGILDDANPMYSHLVLSAPEKTKEDGLLEAWEMMNLKLRADVVVLSACETARGRIGAGEGVIGMSWALFIAGSPVTVVSQWKVDSAATTELMLEFHRNLSGTANAQRLSKARALQQASLKLLRSEGVQDYRHPFYWAGFVLMGDPR